MNKLVNRLLVSIGLVVLFFACQNQANDDKDFTQFVDPFIGTEGTGHTFPGPCLPFGMVQPGPDNRDQGWDYTSGYQYQDSTIIGFSQTRANGTGISEFGDVLLQPVTDSRIEKFGEGYNKQSERATPGYYSVTLRNQVRVELSASERVAFHQYTYPSNRAKLLVDLQHGLRFLTDSLVLESDVRLSNQNSISGFCHTKNWVDRKYFFFIQFDQPFVINTELVKKPKEKAPRYFLEFELKDKVLKTKVALSTVSVEGAITNLKAEIPEWDFDGTVAQAKRKWNEYLSRIEIEADQKQKEIFYSCMYRLFIQPSNIADVDGKYRGADDVVRQAENNEYYSTLSLWDTYRAAHPLYTLIAPEKVNGFVQSMIAHSKAAGFLPIWTAWGQDNYCMIGNHSIPVMADAYKKGFTGFDANAALSEMVKTTSEKHINSNWPLLNKYGYYPFDSLDNEAVSRTLEHGVDDYFVATMAEQLGKRDIATQYFKRASFYKNLYDSTTRQMRGKNSLAKWRTPFNPLMATSPMNNPGDYTEANAWQYFWTPAQYDAEGLMRLLGGKRNFTAQLDSFFTIRALNPNKHLGQEAMIGQYAHGNEPSHHIAYLYAYSEKPQRGRELITQICNQFYNNTPTGMIGNDDCGQMSAWYIFSTLGFYPVNPGNGTFVFGVPQAKKIVVKLAKSKELIISLTSNKQNVSVFEVQLNGKEILDHSVAYSTLITGGKLEFVSENR
ncbi:MAG: GH92 family glycosyl hydrolase [Cytophagales bacterium]|nr:GH92 family glycosyl hydrolase [Cytophagales bacterium]MCA6365652.1 GH92 family glycosyl hydrolase [Cytophagales bacterium]MCA6370424.1 GH92 family glycosyl hydrolase [Cytophagales bacterium]MCA6375588.1 GH92 family glycosyl hydrolase [Cytophagales bacterium]MCA6385162.1 GH92 family glycosyl hydrolase [Cytophagales bacterium]